MQRNKTSCHIGVLHHAVTYCEMFISSVFNDILKHLFFMKASKATCIIIITIQEQK